MFSIHSSNFKCVVSDIMDISKNWKLPSIPLKSNGYFQKSLTPFPWKKSNFRFHGCSSHQPELALPRFFCDHRSVEFGGQKSRAHWNGPSVSCKCLDLRFPVRSRLGKSWFRFKFSFKDWFWLDMWNLPNCVDDVYIYMWYDVCIYLYLCIYVYIYVLFFELEASWHLRHAVLFPLVFWSKDLMCFTQQFWGMKFIHSNISSQLEGLSSSQLG